MHSQCCSTTASVWVQTLTPPPKEPLCLGAAPPSPPAPAPPPAHRLSVPAGLSVLGISGTWDCTVCGLRVWLLPRLIVSGVHRDFEPLKSHLDSRALASQPRRIPAEAERPLPDLKNRPSTSCRRRSLPFRVPTFPSRWVKRARHAHLRSAPLAQPLSLRNSLATSCSWPGTRRATGKPRGPDGT